MVNLDLPFFKWLQYIVIVWMYHNMFSQFPVDRYLGCFQSSQISGFSSSHVWKWELDYKESWAPKNWWFWTVVMENTLEGPLDLKEIQLVHLKGNQSWIFIKRPDVEAETQVLWPPDVKSWLIGKDLDAGQDWRQEDKGMTEDEMVGWHHQLDGHEFEQAPGVGDGQGSLVNGSPRGHEESNRIEWQNWTESFLLPAIFCNYPCSYFLVLIYNNIYRKNILREDFFSRIFEWKNSLDSNIFCQSVCNQKFMRISDCLYFRTYI